MQLNNSDVSNMKIRTMSISDYADVYNLWLSCKGMGLNSLDDSRDGIEKFLKRNPDTCFVAEVDNRIVGSILAGNDGRRGYIYHTAVSPQYQKHGIGSTLVDTAIDALKKLGINKIALVVFDKNDNGNAFWEKQGFSERNDLIYRNKTINHFERIDT